MKKMYAFILIIVLLSLVPRLWNLSKAPPVIVDEPANLRDIHSIFETGLHPLSFHWDFSKSQLVHTPAVITIALVGQENELLGLRLASVLLSIVALIAFFLLVSQMTDQLIGFITTMLLSYSYYFLEFSRVGWTDVIFTIAAGLWLFYFLSQYVITKKIWVLIISSVLAGLLAYSYRSSLIYIFISFMYLFVELVRKKSAYHTAIKGFALYLFVFLIISTPWFYTALKNQDKYMLRQRVVSVQTAELPYHSVNKREDIFFYQVTTSIRSWILLEGIDGGGTENSRYIPTGFAPVNVFIKIGFWVGIVIALSRLTKTYPWFFIFVLGLWFGQIKTVNPPNGSRGLILLPIIYLFFAYSLFEIHKRFRSPLMTYGLGILAIVIALSDFQMYQWWMQWIVV